MIDKVSDDSDKKVRKREIKSNLRNKKSKGVTCNKCGKVGIEHFIWNPRYPYRVYYDVVHKSGRCYNGRLGFNVDDYDDYDYLKALKSMLRDLERAVLKLSSPINDGAAVAKRKTAIIKEDIKKIIQKYIQYTETESYD